jgi:hypothetical protein
MSRKYVRERIAQNFVYPNKTVSEYDIEIVHDINDNSVSGTTSGFDAYYDGTNITVSFNYTWSLNGAERWIDDSGKNQLLSVHMMAPNVVYFKPWRLVGNVSTTNLTGTTISGSTSFVVTPAEMGLTTLNIGEYNFEIRFIGHRAIFPVCQTFTVILPYCENVCKRYGVSNSQDSACVVSYRDCDGYGQTLTIAPGDDFEICACEDSLSYTCILSVTDLGTCLTPTPTPTPTPTCTCRSYTATNDSLESQAQIQWINCSTGEVETQTLNPGTGTSFCACQGTVTVTSGEATITNVGPCITPTPTPTPTPVTEYTGEWTWRNQDLGNANFSSAQINGVGIGTTNMGPSIFPLTSTLYGVTNPPLSGIGNNIAWNSTTVINVGMNWIFFVPGATYFIEIFVNTVSVSLTTMSYGSPYNVVTLSGSTILSTDDVEVVVFGVV